LTVANNQMSNLIKMNDAKTAILTAKVSATIQNVEGKEGIIMMDQMRSLASSLPGNCFA